MKNEQIETPRVNRRGFLKIVAVAGTAGACWKLGLLGSTKKLQVARRSQPIMGTVMNLTAYGPDRESCEEALTKTIGTMQQLESKLSRHMVNSELSTLNKTGVLENPSRDLYQVLTLASELSKKSSGAFDVTMLPLLQFHQNIQGNNGQPNTTQLKAARNLIGYHKLQVSENKLQFTEDGMGATLDGIGKGYIVDQGVASFRNLGYNNVFVEAGGDLMVSGHKEGRTPWRIGIRNPRPTKEQKLPTIEVSDKAVATSGDYLQAFTADLKHHHIIDPHSGFSPPELASCTVTAPNVALADGLATAIMVLGKDHALDLIEPLQGCEAYMVDKELQSFNSSGFFS